ncbi:hypothetical protein BH09PLA1_BH09PLA1_20910 [soil metagenome]
MAKKPQTNSTSAARKGNGKRYSAPVKVSGKTPIKTTSAVKTTAVRNSSIPKTPKVATTNRVVTHELIAERAYFISISGNGGSQDENWTRAESELRSGK